jgi:predicted nucleic acid-binding protein
LLQRVGVTMTSVLVDSSVLLDLATNDPQWSDWSAQKLWDLRDTADMVINAVIYAEVTAAFDTIETADAFLMEIDVRREDVPWAAAFAAGQLFRAHRRSLTERKTPLPDYFIGAHALLCGYQLLSRDAGYLRPMFSGLHVIHPGGQA